MPNAPKPQLEIAQVSGLRAETTALLADLEEALTGILRDTPLENDQLRSRLEHLIALAQRVSDRWGPCLTRLDPVLRDLEGEPNHRPAGSP